MKTDSHLTEPAVLPWIAGFCLAMFTMIIPVFIVLDSGKIHIDTNHPYITHGVHSYASS